MRMSLFCEAIQAGEGVEWVDACIGSKARQVLSELPVKVPGLIVRFALQQVEVEDGQPVSWEVVKKALLALPLEERPKVVETAIHYIGQNYPEYRIDIPPIVIEYLDSCLDTLPLAKMHSPETASNLCAISYIARGRIEDSLRCYKRAATFHDESKERTSYKLDLAILKGEVPLQLYRKQQEEIAILQEQGKTALYNLCTLLEASLIRHDLRDASRIWNEIVQNDFDKFLKEVGGETQQDYRADAFDKSLLRVAKSYLEYCITLGDFANARKVASDTVSISCGRFMQSFDLFSRLKPVLSVSDEDAQAAVDDSQNNALLKLLHPDNGIYSSSVLYHWLKRNI